MRSPRHSDRTVPKCLFPVRPTMAYVFPWPVPGVQNPFPRSEVNVSPSTDVESAWNLFPKGENPIFYNGMRLCSLGLGISSLTLPERSWFCFARKRKRRSSHKAAALPDTLSHVCCQLTPRRSRGHRSLSLAPGRKQDGAESQKPCSSPTNTPSGRPETKQKYGKGRKA